MNLRLSVRFIWYDLWVGVYIDAKQRSIYICPLPCLVFKLWIQTNGT